jgi:hypothetical protein
MSLIGNLGASGANSELWSLVSRRVLRLRFALFLGLSVIASPGFALEKSRDLATYFGGRLTATGQFQNFYNGSTRSLRVDIHGKPRGSAFRLVVDTTYSDGEKSHKVWEFWKVAEGRYVGRRADLIGSATVEAQGNTIEIVYRARVRTKDGKTHDLDFKEIFQFTQPGMATYWLRASRLFVPVGEARLILRKQPR